MSQLRRLCVYCGSKFGNNPAFRAAADELGQAIASRGIELVYGGGSVGLMGAVTDSVLHNDGHVIGVIPERLATEELLHRDVPDMRVTADMHTRKAMMADLSDAFVAMPGGFGTFEEFFEVVTWAQLKMHHKPIGLLNIDGFYNPLIQLIDHTIDAGFIKPANRDLFIVRDSTGDLLKAIDEFLG